MPYTPDRVVIISDLHLGPGGRYDFFHAEAALTRFIHYQAEQPGSLDLVILGDALDYLQIKPFLSFTVQDAVAKTQKIVKQNGAIFAALAKLIEGQGQAPRRLIWAIGNHDLELLFPQVQRLIETELGVKPGDERLLWELAGGHRDYESAAGTVRLVHGNEPDPWNRVDYAAASEAVEQSGTKGSDASYRYPPGSVLVARVLNELKNDGHTYIDLLKPETTVALPLAIALWPDRTWELLQAAFAPLAKVTASGLATQIKNLILVDQSVLAGDPVMDPSALPEPAGIEELLAHALGATLRTDAEMDEDDFGQTTAWLTSADDDAVQDLLDGPPKSSVLSRSWGKDAMSWLLRGAARRMNGFSEAFDLEGADDNDAIIRRTLQSGVRLVVAGHTHLARAIHYPGGFYINTGTWADLIHLPRKLPKEEFTAYARRLKDMFAPGNQPAGACRPFQRLTYAEIELAAGRWALRQWAPEPTLTLQVFP